MLKGKKTNEVSQNVMDQGQYEDMSWKVVNGFGLSVKGTSKYNYRISEREIKGEKVKVLIRTDTNNLNEEQKTLDELSSSMVAKIMYKDGFNILEKLDDKKKNSPSFIVDILDTAKEYKEEEKTIPNALAFPVMKNMFKGNELFETVAKMSELKANISQQHFSEEAKYFKQTMLELATMEKAQQRGQEGEGKSI